MSGAWEKDLSKGETWLSQYTDDLGSSGVGFRRFCFLDQLDDLTPPQRAAHVLLYENGMMQPLLGPSDPCEESRTPPV